MKTTDRFLIGIVAAIAIVVVAALVLTRIRPEPTYRADEGPEGVAHNYLLALEKGDYARAYGYLSPTLDGYPASEGEFAATVLRERWMFRRDEEVTLAVASHAIAGDAAAVQVHESRFSGGGLFHTSSYTSRFEIALRLEEGGWKIVESEAYFAPCWLSERGCAP
ncbi:MAG: hypothetical protein JXA09_09285 [Anaerolineae bacterium]|nr:hypothetical protein [Anaerolineae bacterium]